MPSLSPASTIIAGNLGSPPLFNPRNGWTVDGGVEAGQMLAVAFTSAQAVIFEDARLPLGIIFSNLAVSPLGVYLAASVDELPGADIANLSLESGQRIGAWPPGNLVTFGCTACPTLTAGTQYWLVVDIPDLNENYFESQAAWNWNVTQNYSNGLNFVYNDTQFGTGWLYRATSELRPAFEIDATATSEPSTLLLTGAVLALLGIGLAKGRTRIRLQSGPARSD
ncbi:MAG: hypothetical protein ABSF64_35725 [Bryobacteraceae bacterium]|jgi:hypothetical protein